MTVQPEAAVYFRWLAVKPTRVVGEQWLSGPVHDRSPSVLAPSQELAADVFINGQGGAGAAARSTPSGPQRGPDWGSC